MKKKDPRQYYRNKGFVFVVDHVTKTVTVPSSLIEEDYPEEVLGCIKKEKYFKQLTIE